MSAVIILALVTAQRLGELVLARRNTRALRARGAYEVGPDHYPLIVVTHAFWLATLWWLAPGRPTVWPLIGLFLLLQVGRFWVLRTLGTRWTTRVIVLPGEPLVTGGPFRFVRSEEHTSELQSLMRISYAVFCLKKKIKIHRLH